MTHTSQPGLAIAGDALAGFVGASGTISMAGPVVGPRSVTAPTILSGLITMLAPVGPHRAFSVPVVAGPIISAAVVGQRHVPAPTVRLTQNIVLGAAVAAGRAIPRPTVAHVLSITMAGPVVGSRAVPSPDVHGAPQFITLATVPTRRAVPAPTITGGELATRLYLSGVEVDLFSWVQNTCRIESQTIGRWKATFSLEQLAGITGYRPELGQSVQIVDRGRRLFAGCISAVRLVREMSTASVLHYQCTAVDKAGICDRRIVTGQTYPTGSDAAGVVQTIVSTYLNGEGILISAESFPPGQLGALSSDLVCNFITVTAAFDRIASDTGTVWWVSPSGVLFFSPLVDLPAAPFALTETSRNWRNLTAEQTTTDYYNKLYCVSNLNILPGSGTGGGPSGTGTAITEQFVWVPDGPGIDTVVNPADGARLAVGLTCSTGVGFVQSITVNGVDDTFANLYTWAGELYHWGYLGSYQAPFGNVPGSPTIAAAGGYPPAGAVVVVTYFPGSTLASSQAQYGSALTPINPHGDPLGRCGSGWFEGVVQVQDISDRDQLNAIAQAELSRIGGVPTVVDYETDWPGLEPGQLQTANIPLSGLNNLQLLITSVSGVFIPPGPLGAHGGSFRWQVQARSNLDPGNQWKWFERLVGRTNNALPVLQYETATFVLGAGSAVSSGVSLTNPYLVGRTGRVVQLMVAASTPPAGQDLTLTIRQNGQPVASIVLPHTATANALQTLDIPQSQGLYFFAQDVLSCDASYSSTGGATQKAANVTLACRWAI